MLKNLYPVSPEKKCKILYYPSPSYHIHFFKLFKYIIINYNFIDFILYPDMSIQYSVLVTTFLDVFSTIKNITDSILEFN